MSQHVPQTSSPRPNAPHAIPIVNHGQQLSLLGDRGISQPDWLPTSAPTLPQPSSSISTAPLIAIYPAPNVINTMNTYSPRSWAQSIQETTPLATYATPYQIPTQESDVLSNFNSTYQEANPLFYAASSPTSTEFNMPASLDSLRLSSLSPHHTIQDSTSSVPTLHFSDHNRLSSNSMSSTEGQPASMMDSMHQHDLYRSWHGTPFRAIEDTGPHLDASAVVTNPACIMSRSSPTMTYPYPITPQLTPPRTISQTSSPVASMAVDIFDLSAPHAAWTPRSLPLSEMYGDGYGGSVGMDTHRPWNTFVGSSPSVLGFGDQARYDGSPSSGAPDAQLHLFQRRQPEPSRLPVSPSIDDLRLDFEHHNGPSSPVSTSTSEDVSTEPQSSNGTITTADVEEASPPGIRRFRRKRKEHIDGEHEATRRRQGGRRRGTGMRQPAYKTQEDFLAAHQGEVTFRRIGEIWMCSCGKSFKREDIWSRHKEWKRGQFQCDECAVPFSRKDALQRHMTNEHGRKKRETKTAKQDEEGGADGVERKGPSGPMMRGTGSKDW
ncbi:hypothetical protein K488DRAFT_83849 [Vararia minispora EC-137]|uniref:Uncharacterized protein n=1 Tax=Vararia minispora EC-137 TaxID=1314806 RepID=A0ACB8QRP1_9AGAM|nr:hypothetical protein K488DRAFT_83849 [Vararia minispora EC-137]